MSPPTILSPFPEQVGSLVSDLEAPLTEMCPQVKRKACHSGWRAAGLLLLLTMVTAGVMAGGLLGFMYSSPKVSTSLSLGGHRVGRGQETWTCQVCMGPGLSTNLEQIVREPEGTKANSVGAESQIPLSRCCRCCERPSPAPGYPGPTKPL